MSEDKKDYYSLQEIVNSIGSFLHYLRKRWWMLVFSILLGAGLAIVYYFVQKPKYEAVSTFILEEKTAGGSGLAGLASQFGFSLGALGGGASIFSGDNILDILKSKKIVQEVLLSDLNTVASGKKTLADLYLEFNEFKKKWKKRPVLANINFTNSGDKLTPLQDSVVNVLYEKIIKKNLAVERLSKKGSIIVVKVTASNEVFARLMTERLVDAASKLYLDIRTGTSQENIRELQRRSDSLLLLLNRKSFSAAATQLIDLNPALRTAVVPTEIANRDKTVLATVYGEVTKNLEASKLLLSQQTPVIQLLDKPGELLDSNKKSAFFLLVVFSAVSCAIFILFISAVYYIKNVITSNKGLELSK